MIITLANYQALTGDSSNDTLVNSLIPAVNDLVQLYCDRTFDEADYSDWFEYSENITLTQYPITQVKFIGYAQKVAQFSNSTDYNYQVSETGITVTKDSDFTQTSFPFSAYATLAALKTAIETAYPTITLTIETGFTTLNYRLIKQGFGDTLYGAVRNSLISRITGYRTLEVLASLQNNLYLPFFDILIREPLFVLWTAGYTSSTMPKGLQLIVANIVRDLVVLKTELPKGGAIKSESLSLTNADYSYTLGDNALIQKIINENYASGLDFYRKVTV